MSKLELFIKRCREIWEEMSVESVIMDKMIDTFIRQDLDLDKVTDEDIKLSTQSFINNITFSEREEKDENK